MEWVSTFLWCPCVSHNSVTCLVKMVVILSSGWFRNKLSQSVVSRACSMQSNFGEEMVESKSSMDLRGVLGACCVVNRGM